MSFYVEQRRKGLLGSLNHVGTAVGGTGVGDTSSAGGGVVVVETSLGGLASLDSTVVVVGEILVVRELATLEVERRVVALSEREQVEEGKDRLGEQVKDAIEHHLAVRGDCV